MTWDTWEGYCLTEEGRVHIALLVSITFSSRYSIQLKLRSNLKKHLCPLLSDHHSNSAQSPSHHSYFYLWVMWSHSSAKNRWPALSTQGVTCNKQSPIAFMKSSAGLSVLSRISPNHNPGALGPQGVSQYT